MSGDLYELIYWDKERAGAGRAEFIRLIFEEAKVAYKHIDKDIPDKLRRAAYPAFAVPLIRKGDFELSQTPTICRYLGKQFGFYPETDEDAWHADQVNQTIHDYLGSGRLAFHGIDPVGSYSSQKEATQPYIDRFVRDRLPKFINHFERVLAANNGGKRYVIGNTMTYVDLGLLHVLRATEAQFPDTWENIDYAPLVKAFKLRMEARPNLLDYFKSDRCIPFSGDSMM